MVITFAYRLFDAEGELVEAGDPEEPLGALLGYGEVAPALEQALDGARPGDRRKLKLRAEDAFGPRDPDLIVEFERGEFPAEVAVGDEFEAEDAEGRVVPLKIVDLDAERVVVDHNHPLAGQAVALELELLSVRPAEAEELERSIERLEAETGRQAAAALLPVEALLRHLPGGPNGGTKPGPAGAPPGSRAQTKRGKPT